MPTHYKGPARITRALNAYINLARAASSMLARETRELDQRRLTVGQFGVLEAVLHLGPMKQRSLAEKLLCGGANITMVVDHLEMRGLVRRERQPDDRRTVLVHLTPKGSAVIKKVFKEHAHFIAEQMAVLPPNEQEQLRHLCRKLGLGSRNSF
jgi:MarR family transcriptional regulator, 2-MHQ and catechol-resistance regulon repressor